MTYLHGSYGTIQATQDIIPAKAETLPVYFGVLPVHQLMDYSGKVNKPILVQNYNDAVSNVGYNDKNWKDFDLCEAVYAHFKNSIQPVGPIVLINVLDPDKMKKENKTASINLVNGKGYIDNEKVILNTLSLQGLTLGVDFNAEYTVDGTRVLVTDLKGTLTSPITATFDEVDTTLVTKDVVIGGTINGEITGISAVSLVYQTLNKIPTILAAPGWSYIPEVDTALKEISQKINGHWYAWVNSDLGADATTATINEAINLKTSKGYTGAGEAPSWPMAKNKDKVFHISTLATVTMQQVDLNNDNIPFETPSNKPIDITGLCLEDGSAIDFDKIKANELNSKGIRTAIFWGGKWVLWGPHTGAYDYDLADSIDPKDKFDSNIRMLYFLLNDFQSRYGIEVDKPMTRSRIQSILNDYKERIDSFINIGALLYGNIEFNETNNDLSDFVEGDFSFDIATTVTPPGKSISAQLQYTNEGLNILFGGDLA